MMNHIAVRSRNDTNIYRLVRIPLAYMREHFNGKLLLIIHNDAKWKRRKEGVGDLGADVDERGCGRRQPTDYFGHITKVLKPHRISISYIK